MQFKHPELLYALFLLLIPIIVHLFQLRKFQKVDFTNVAFLREATLQTRKSAVIKKWLILCTRLLLLAALVLAFAQPYTSKNNTFKTKKETVIYLDNSFSMQAKGDKGELLIRAIQDVISNVPEDENISIITNNNTYRNTTIKAIKNDLLQLSYASNKLTTEAALLKSKTILSKEKGTQKNLIFISDFQEDHSLLNLKTDSLTHLHLVKLSPVNTNNIAIDSAFISETNPTSITLKVQLKNSGIVVDNLPVSLYNDEQLIAKTSVAINKKAETTFSLPVNQVINGKISISDTHLQFDNNLFFNINNTSKVNVLSINNADDGYLRRIYKQDEFYYTATKENQLNYNLIESQNLIILNELKTVPLALVSALKQFTSQGGWVIIVPSTDINVSSYNTLLEENNISFSDLVPSEKRVTTINYAHTLYNKGVFEKQVKNFQYPKVNNYYGLNSKNIASVLSFEDGKLFLGQYKNTFVFTSALNDKNSSFKNSPLIVPTFYNIAKQSFKIPELYYTIGNENTFEVETQLQQDAVLSIISDKENIIPKQQLFNKKVIVSTSETPSSAATYKIVNNVETIKNVSYNYSRTESDLTYRKLSVSNQVYVSDSISEIFDAIKSDAKVNALWKWFAIFALVLLIIEMVILKFFK
ncbi:BatA domain-containing protein [uncultured Algibacter sp.]|uniref:BatA domain-containing protein n=1 Tax=uncultured Algibacter sp. TaxID=298659 RepID=UPI003217F1D5